MPEKPQTSNDLRPPYSRCRKPLLLTLINPQAAVSSCAFIIALLARPVTASLHPYVWRRF